MSNIIQSFFQTSDLFFDIGSNRENLDLKTEIGETLYNSDYVKRVIIPSEVTVGSATTTSAALKIPEGLGGRLLIDNYGSIQGAGGAAGGGTGGDAILAQSTCTIENKPTGTIYAGGGGGGQGGTGGTGGPGSYAYIASYTPVCVRYQARPAPRGGPYCSQFANQANYATAYTSGGPGGSGGSGGAGRGYGQSLTTGSTGVAGVAGGTNAGTGGSGGTGGTGGDWGQSGNTGNIGDTGANGNNGVGLAGATGVQGGLAGYYINGLSSNVNFINNGTSAGRTN
jgi:hypothetical protein